MKRTTAPSSSAQSLVLDAQVLPHVRSVSLDEHFQTHGMYPPAPESRQGAAAFAVRPDVSLRDVLETVDSLLRQAEGVASVMVFDSTADDAIVNAADALRYLLQQARGMHSLVSPVLHSAVLDVGAAAQLRKVR